MKNNSTDTRKKIAVLGGGIGSLTAALELANSKENYEITVFQPGWRLGGKGASGRNMNPQFAYRIEEHGLHVWSGLYDNAFRVIRQCYDTLDRPRDTPLSTWENAFTRSNQMVLWEKYQNKWLPWVVHCPENSELPGEDQAKPHLSMWAYINEGIKYLFAHALRSEQWKYQVTTWSYLKMSCWYFSAISLQLASILPLLFFRFLKKMPFLQRLIMTVMGWIMKVWWLFIRDRLNNDKLRRSWMVMNFGYGMINGIVKCNILAKGLSSLDDHDFIEWMSKFIIDDGGLTLASPLGTFIYDAQFSYIDGDLNKPNFAAGSAILTIFRMAFTFKGALIWKMNAGMGDTIFTPIYLALKSKGVKFEFFHQVTNIGLTDDRKSVKSISVFKQADLKDSHKEYQPLVTIKGLQCWPSTPLGEQISGEIPKLEISTEIDPDKVKTLVQGTDFDLVVLGVPVRALESITEELSQASDRWANMLNQVKTVQTQALQLWFKKTADEYDFVGTQEPLTVCYHESALNTFADMTDLIHREGWPALGTEYPQSLFYLCGPKATEELTLDVVLDLLEKKFGVLLPQATNPPSDINAPLDWEQLVDNTKKSTSGKERVRSQYIRANTIPSEQFTLTLAKTNQFRLKPGDSGFHHLYLAGDWTRNSFNLGNIESTVMSGMLASNSICGNPPLDHITGLNFGEPTPWEQHDHEEKRP